MRQQTIVWQDGKLTDNPPPQMVADALRDPKALVWYDVQGDPAEYAPELARTFALTPFTIEALQDDHALTKLRQVDGYFHLVVHGLTLDQAAEAAATPKLDVIFGHTFLVTSRCGELAWLDELRDSIAQGTADENPMSRGMAYLLYVVLDTLVDSYFPVLDGLDDIIDDLENATVSRTSNAVQARLFRVKRMVAGMRRVINPQVEVCNALIVRTGDVIPGPLEPYFATVHDHMVRAFDVLDSYRDLLSGLLDVYLTTVSNRMNQVMKQLTIIATIFLPISFVTGVFGQNFGHMPQVEHDAGFNFWLALLLMAVIAGSQLWYFWRRGWL
jgi:magnesium transporter